MTRIEKYQMDAITRTKIKKVARLRDHPATPSGERRAAFAATERLVRTLHFSKKSYIKHFGDPDAEDRQRTLERILREPLRKPSEGNR